MTRAWWVAVNAVSVAVIAVVLGLLTDNPNWPLNMPCGLVVGYLWGWFTWPLVLWFARWLGGRW